MEIGAIVADLGGPPPDLHDAILISVNVDASTEIARRLEAARLEFTSQAQRFERAHAQLQATVDIRNRNSFQNMLQYSEFARMRAKLSSMPVIEQAKGILMSQQRCGPDEAFDLLRRASQRANIKVRVLAEQIIAGVASDIPRSRGEVPLLVDWLNGKEHVNSGDGAAVRSDRRSSFSNQYPPYSAVE
jgi:hypothetical protein